MQKIRIHERDVVNCPELNGSIVPVSSDYTDSPYQRTCKKCRFFQNKSCYYTNCQSNTPLPPPAENPPTPIFTGL
jgi:hypothetical protein